MEILPLKISGALRMVLNPYKDDRGFFFRTYDKEVLSKHGLNTEWVQESHSFSAKVGTVRGLHFQIAPHAETKIVRAGHGKIFMVLVDLRPLHFGACESMVLSVECPEALYVPKGVAMGMCTLSDDYTLLYKMDAMYSPASARTVRWNDPSLNIVWPVVNPILSDKDKTAPLLKELVAAERTLKF